MQGEQEVARSNEVESIRGTLGRDKCSLGTRLVKVWQRGLGYSECTCVCSVMAPLARMKFRYLSQAQLLGFNKYKVSSVWRDLECVGP